MKQTMFRALAAFLTLVLLLGACPFPAFAAPSEGAAEGAQEGAEEEAPESAALDPAAEAEETVSLRISGGDETGADYAGEQAEMFPEDAFTEVLEGTESLGGTEELTPEDNRISLGGDDETLGFGETVDGIEAYNNDEIAFEEGSELPLDDSETGDAEENEDLGLFGATVSAGTSSLAISKGQSTAVIISYSNVPKNGKLKAGAWKFPLFKSDAVSLSWDGASGGRATLRIQGVQAGTCYVEVFVCNSLGIPYAVTQIKVNVSEATLTCTSSLSNFQVAAGSSKTIYFKTGGYSGAAALTYTTTNNTAYTCTLRSGTMTITGKQQGQGTVRVRYQAQSTGDTLAELSFNVSVTAPAVPRLTLSTSGLTVPTGEARTVSVTYSGYAGSVRMSCCANSRAVGCEWVGGWSGNTATLRLTGAQTGSATVEIYLKDSAGSNLTSATLRVNVAPKPVITGNKSSLQVVSGSSGAVNFTLKNVSSQNTIACINPASNICTAALSQKNGTYVLTVAGKNTGTANLRVVIRDAFGNEAASAGVSVQVVPAPPTIRVTDNRPTVKAGSRTSVTFTVSNCSGEYYLSFQKNSSRCTLSWGSWSGTSIPLYITGVEPGSCTVTLRLYQNKKEVASGTVTVTVEPSSGGKHLDINSVSYGFDNYSTVVSLENCQRIFGKNQIARSVYNSQDGIPHGVCFGMATTATLFYCGAESTNQFGASRTSGLKEANKTVTSSRLDMTLADFIESMYTSQFTVSLAQTKNTDLAAKAIISEIDAGRPVCLGFNGKWGHEVTAIGYSLSGNTLTVDIYDNNYHQQVRTMTITRASASAPFSAWTYGSYNSSNHKLDYSEYASIAYTWRNRGNYSVISKPMKGMNLVWTDEDDFSLYTMDFDSMEPTTVARYAGGVLTDALENVYDVPVYNEDEEYSVHYLFVPADYYFVQDDTPEDGIHIAVAGETLSTTIQTDVSGTELGAMGFCASEKERLAEASVTVADGAAFTVSIGTTDADGVSKTVVKEGIGNGQAVHLGLSGDTLSLGAAEDCAAAELTEATVQDTYAVTAYAGPGGGISPEGVTVCREGENLRLNVTEDEGYEIAALLVDGKDVGPLNTWYFENITESHAVSVTFRKSLSLCSIQLEQDRYSYDGTAFRPAVTLLDDAGEPLTEDVDYILSYSRNVLPGKAAVTAVALPDSGYFGTLEAAFDIEGSGEDWVLSAETEDGTLLVTLAEAAYQTPHILTAAVYEAGGRFLFCRQAALETAGAPVRLPLDSMPQGAQIKLFLLSQDGLTPEAPVYPAT